MPCCSYVPDSSGSLKWSPLGVIKQGLSYTHIGLLCRFNSKFPTNIFAHFIWDSNYTMALFVQHYLLFYIPLPNTSHYTTKVWNYSNVISNFALLKKDWCSKSTLQPCSVAVLFPQIHSCYVQKAKKLCDIVWPLSIGRLVQDSKSIRWELLTVCIN